MTTGETSDSGWQARVAQPSSTGCLGAAVTVLKVPR
jgi:hypothetical protein